ncbi:MAG TPA: hypothetical protein VL098_08005 [Flavipsychrobacter sp.]|nr:hypothetical protein [Flavipsychrobacter sp.]
MNKFSSIMVAAVVAGFSATAQTTYLQLNNEDYPLLDKMETLSGELTNKYFTTVKPAPRSGIVQYLLEKREQALPLKLSKIDRYNIDHAISVSGEWTPDENGAIDSKKPWFKTFYKKQPDFLHVNSDKFFLVVNPVISAQLLGEKNTVGNDNHYMSSRGVEFRGWIAKKIGFYTYFTDNQEQPVGFVDQYINRGVYKGVPGADFYMKPSNNHYDYLLAQGYVDFQAVKDHLNVTFGYGKNFYGDGMRSLFLSDFSANYPFLRLNTKIWKLNYQNLYVELTPQFIKGADARLPRKYATIHSLSVNATKWLNIGVFESVVFGRRDRFEFGYMNPIILYRSVERAFGSPDNVNLGINFKAIVAKRLQFYGQFMLDEFTSKEFFGGNGYWGNKWALQLGGKYFDALGIKNLDLQGELNVVRPFTYSHYDSTANYSHYNQPMAHPLGAGFIELIGLARYQPIEKLYITAKGMYYKQGADTGSANYGSDIFKDYRTRNASYNVGIINGISTSVMLANLNVSYELRENLFIDLGFTHRRFVSENTTAIPNYSTTYGYGGFRLNIARRDYDFY